MLFRSSQCTEVALLSFAVLSREVSKATMERRSSRLSSVALSQPRWMFMTFSRTDGPPSSVRLGGDMGGSDWRAEDTIHLEAGQLERIAREATAYFG